MTAVKVDGKEEDAPPPQVDFFADMVPEFKQPAQIRVRGPGTPPLSAGGAASRLSMDSVFNVVGLVLD